MSDEFAKDVREGAKVILEWAHLLTQAEHEVIRTAMNRRKVRLGVNTSEQSLRAQLEHDAACDALAKVRREKP